MPAGATTVDMDKLLRMVDVRLNGGTDPLATVRKLNDRRIEVTPMRRNSEDRGRVERQLTRPGTLEFRILANRHVDKALDRSRPERTGKGRDTRSVRQAAGLVGAGEGRLAASVSLSRYRQTHPESGRSRGHGNPRRCRPVQRHRRLPQPGQASCSIRVEEPGVGFTFNDAGGQLFGKLTGDHLPNKSTGVTYKLGIIIDGELFSAPTIQSKIGTKAEITGSFTEIEVSDLAAALNAGSLPVRLRLVEERPRP